MGGAIFLVEMLTFSSPKKKLGKNVSGNVENQCVQTFALNQKFYSLLYLALAKSSYLMIKDDW